MMTGARVISIDELRAFLASNTVLPLKGISHEETYAWFKQTLRTYGRLFSVHLQQETPFLSRSRLFEDPC